MLREIAHVKQVSGEPRCRWFQDDQFDLFIWQDERQNIVEFELCLFLKKFTIDRSLEVTGQ